MFHMYVVSNEYMHFYCVMHANLLSNINTNVEATMASLTMTTSSIHLIVVGSTNILIDTNIVSYMCTCLRYTYIYKSIQHTYTGIRCVMCTTDTFL